MTTAGSHFHPGEFSLPQSSQAYSRRSQNCRRRTCPSPWSDALTTGEETKVSDIGEPVNNYIGRSFYSLQIFTDGSKDRDSGHTGAGIYITQVDVELC